MRNTLVIATREADADYLALDELAFVPVFATILVSNSVYVGPADTSVISRSRLSANRKLGVLGGTFPISGVVSMGRRNTFVKFTRRRLKTQSLSWALI